MTLLWVDDVRPAPPGWAWAKTAREALAVLRTDDVEYASLDCDLADEHENGVWLVKAMVALKLWPRFKPGVHSSNWKLAGDMLFYIRRHGPYDEFARAEGRRR
jgi:hypothetical protein